MSNLENKVVAIDNDNTDMIVDNDNEDNDNKNSKDNKETKLVVDMSELKLTSNDGKTFTVPKGYATNLSKVIKTTLEETGGNEMPVNVNSVILEEIVKYMNIHKGVEGLRVPQPLRD